MPRVDSVNIGRPRPNPYKPVLSTGIAKEPQSEPVWVRDPGPKGEGEGSGLVGDHIGDVRSHGGSDQAVYAFGREELDIWEARLERPVPNGFFGENLTICGIDVNEALVGERWRVGESAELRVTCPRIPCATFRGWVDEPLWLKIFTAAARPGAYLAVVEPGWLRAGDTIDVVHKPDHDVTVALMFRALTTSPELLSRLAAAGDDLPEQLRQVDPVP
jgi:MOSC domain-containing protein YiiM